MVARLAPTPLASDAQLVKRACRKDQKAFEVLLHAYEQPIFNLCFRMLGEAAEAEDATQEVFLRAYRHLAAYDCQRSFKTWLYAIASHYCIDCLRRRHGYTLSLEEDSTTPELILYDPQPGPENILIRRERTALIQVLLKQLRPKDRLVIVLRYWCDMPYREIATVTHTSVSAVRSRLNRARTALAGLLPRFEGEFNPALN